MTLTEGQIARICHEANRALQIVQADPTIPISPHWDELDEQTQESAIIGVLGVLDGATPEESHKKWCDYKIEHGWKWGRLKDMKKLEHPLLMPYAWLPASHRVKDDLFLAIARTLG